MFTSPLFILSITIVALFILSVYSLSVAQTCADRADGTLRSDRPVRSLLAQKERAERTAAWAFGLAFLASMFLVGTMEFSSLV